MKAASFYLSPGPARYYSLLAKCLLAFLAGAGLTACGTTREAQRAAFSQKMESLHDKAVKGRVSRTRVTAALGLSGPPAERISGGARGGYTTDNETWRLPWGDSIMCREHYPLSKKDAIFTREAIDALIAGHPSPAMKRMMKKSATAATRPSNPPRWYDTLELRDQRNRPVWSVEWDYQRYRPSYRDRAG